MLSRKAHKAPLNNTRRRMIIAKSERNRPHLEKRLKEFQNENRANQYSKEKAIEMKKALENHDAFLNNLFGTNRRSRETEKVYPGFSGGARKRTRKNAFKNNVNMAATERAATERAATERAATERAATEANMVGWNKRHAYNQFQNKRRGERWALAEAKRFPKKEANQPLQGESLIDYWRAKQNARMKRMNIENKNTRNKALRGLSAENNLLS